MESVERPFGELPAALVDEVLKRTEELSSKLWMILSRSALVAGNGERA